MKRFVFRYQNLLKMKEDLVEEIKGELSRHHNRLFVAQEKLTHYLFEQETYAKQIEERFREGCPASELIFIRENKSYYQEQIQTCKGVIKKIEKEIDETQQRLAEAMKEKKIYEKLKEKEEALYFEEILHAENKVIEELVNYKNYHDKLKGEV